MSATTATNGRLGNQLIRNLAMSLLAEKFNLKFEYSSHELFEKLGIHLFSGTEVHPTTNTISDEQYFTVYHSASLDCNLNPNARWFQTKEISNFLYNHLHSEKSKSAIIDKNPFKERYQNNNDLFIHVRLTDIAYQNPGISYYLDGIKNISFDNMYISTDEQNHCIIRELLCAYPNAILIDYDEIATFQFASTCKYILLSQGTFSLSIGYLSFYSEVYYPDNIATFCGGEDIFSIPGWHKLKIKS